MMVNCRIRSADDVIGRGARHVTAAAILLMSAAAACADPATPDLSVTSSPAIKLPSNRAFYTAPSGQTAPQMLRAAVKDLTATY